MRRSALKTGVVLSVSLSLVIGLSACAKRPAGGLETPFEGKEPFAAAVQTDAVLAERYETYRDNLPLAFRDNEPASADAFETVPYEDGVMLSRYVGEDKVVVIPETLDGRTVLAIGAGCFADTGVRAVQVPDGVRYIEKSAFADCDGLTTLALPLVGDGKENSHFGVIFGADGYEDHPLAVPPSLDYVILSEGVTALPDNAFAGCKSLSVLSLPDSLTRIGAFALFECRDLVLLSLPSGPLAMGDYALGRCDALYALELPPLTQVGEGILYACSAIEELTVACFDDIAFLGSLFGAENAAQTASFVPSSLRRVTLGEDCVSLPDLAFAGCLELDEVVFSRGLRHIGVRAFYGCRSLTEVVLPDSLVTLSDDAFFGCDSLVSADLGRGIESLGMQAFYGCTALESVSWSDKLTALSPSCFALCRSLERVEWKNVKTVGKDAFWGCDALVPSDVSGMEIAEGNEVLLPPSGEDQ